MDCAPNDTLQTLADPELVRLLVSGNHDAMTVIFDRYWRLVMSVALRITHDPADADDVVQTVFTEFYQKAELFDESKGNLRTWLLQYAYERSFNQKRRLRARDFEHVEVEDLENEGRTGGPQHVSHVERQDAAILVEELLPHLTPKQRQVIEKAFFEGMKLSEVASQSGEPVGNVRHAYYRGIEKLRSLLSRPSLWSQPSKEPRVGQRELLWLRKSRKDGQPLAREVDIA